MSPSALLGERVGVLGLGEEGASVVRWLRAHGHSRTIVALADRPAPPPDGVALHTGADALAALREVAVLVRSPGFPPHHEIVAEADRLGVPRTTATNLFVGAARAAGAHVVGVTGSKGKSTTSTLCHLLLAEAGLDAALVGNIGRPALDVLDDVVARRRTVVFEMSSYQCHDLVLGPDTALLLDLFPEHMDWHGSVDAYYASKLRITATQRAGDRFVHNASVAAEVAAVASHAVRRATNHPDDLHFAEGAFRHAERVLFRDAMRLLGTHNRRNACAALAAVEHLGVAEEHLHSVVQRFEGLPFRLQDRGVRGGLTWINDAISTAPEAAAAALDGGGTHTLIAGGLDRGYDFSPLVAAILAWGVGDVVVVPDSGAKLAAGLRAHPRVHVHEADDLAHAVAIAARVTPGGGRVVFSPASPSYNAFKNFEERGRAFDALIDALG